ncbi:MAG: Nif11-like leader peptide family natural product precursor [Actinomycetes bacterium]
MIDSESVTVTNVAWKGQRRGLVVAEEQLSAFTAHMQEDPALQDDLKAATSAEQALAIAADHWFAFTTDDLALPDAGVPDAELEEAAGGYGTYMTVRGLAVLRGFGGRLRGPDHVA